MIGPRSARTGLRRDRRARFGLTVVGLFVVVALSADLLAADLPIALHFRGVTYVLPAIVRPAALRAFDNQRLRREMTVDDWAWMPLVEFGPAQHAPALRPAPASPDRDHWLGTDDRGRDVLARLVHGTRVSLLVGFGAALLQLAIGVPLGLLGGYRGGWLDGLVTRLIEIGLSFPTFFLILTIMALLEGRSLVALVVVIGVTRWTSSARLCRAEVLRLRELDFVLAARAYGASTARIVWRHLLPNALSPVLVNATFGVAAAILAEAALSFLGFGAPPPTASWGEVLGQAYEQQSAWWLVVCPGLLLVTLIGGLNALAEALRDAMSPTR